MPDNTTSSDQPFHVVVIGAGIAGLTCTRQLLEAEGSPIHVTLVEASDRVGGRIRKASNGSDLDLGAEFVHGRGHILWDWILDFQKKGILPTQGYDHSNGGETKEEPFENGLEPFFVVSHADGGPQYGPTQHGKVGMYYMDGELIKHNDKKIQYISQVLGNALDYDKHFEGYTEHTSVAEAIAKEAELSKSTLDMIAASYGNTAGSCDLSQLSAKQMMAFENYWENNEVEGDYRPTFHMHRLVDAIMTIIQQDKNKDRFLLQLNRPVSRVHLKPANGTSKTRVEFSNGSIEADAVVVAVPPTQVARLFDNGHDLTEAKQKALEMIGCSRVSKVTCRFRRPLWSADLQSLIARNEEPVPEIWFRECKGSDAILATGYLGSEAARDFAEALNSRQLEAPTKTREEVAGKMFVEQLSRMFKIPLADLEKEYIPEETIFYDWKEHEYIEMGYMFCKVGMTTKDLQAIAEPMDDSIYFAGEATNINACCTIQAAMETGVRAASEVTTQLQRMSSTP